jgi:hypothetical protein
LKEEEEELGSFMKGRFKDQQTKSRHKRREYSKQYEEEDLAKLTPEERQKKVDKKLKRKEYKLMKEQEMFEECLEHQGRGWMQPEEEIYLRKLIRKDIREMIKMERMAEYKGETTDSEFDSGEENMDRRIEDKVMFGSDSDKDIDEYVLSKLKGQIERGEVKFIDNENEEEYDEEYDEEGEDE